MNEMALTQSDLAVEIKVLKEQIKDSKGIVKSQLEQELREKIILYKKWETKK